MKEKEHFYFRDGINRKKSPLLLGEGESHTLQGYSFEEPGVLEPRPTRTSQYTITTLSYQQGLHKYETNVYAFNDHPCHGYNNNAATWAADGLTTSYFNHIYRRGTTGTPSYSKIGISRGSDRIKGIGYKKFLFLQDGEDLFALDDQYKFGWRIPNPTYAPYLVEYATGVLSSGAVYNYCYTYHLTFPNGQTVETGPSPAASITITGEDNSVFVWAPKFCTDFFFNRDNVTVRTRFYVTTDGGSVYYLLSESFTASLYVNPAYSAVEYPYTTTWPGAILHSVTDANLLLLSTLETTSYDAIPTGINDIEFYLQKIFAIKDDKLYWSEDYLPFNWESAYNFITVSRDGEDLVAICAWGDRLWLASAARWYCLAGTSDDTWSIKQTWTDHGVINRNTVKSTEYGILGQHYDGIRLFNGYNSRNITENILGKEFFDTIATESACYAEWDGRRYYFYYPTYSDDYSATTISGCIVLDFCQYPKIRCFQDDFIATGHFYYPNEGVRYLGKTTAEYQEVGEAETIASTWRTREATFGSPDERKALQQLHYDIKGTVSIAIYADGSLAQTISVSETSRKREMVRLGRIEGYRFYIIVTCSATSSLEIYEPLTLTATIAGTP